jgi:hypothetical protein
MKRMMILGLLLACANLAGAGARDYRFDGKISRPVLENYLSRAVTESDLLNGRNNTDDLRMRKNIGAKFIGRALIMWGWEDKLPGLLARAPETIKQLHAADADVIVQGTAFEIVSRRVESLAVPEWVFKEFGLPVEQRHFRYEAMLYPDGLFKGHWGRDASVPDMSQLETRMWFFYLAAAYINAGFEAIHFGQVELMERLEDAVKREVKEETGLIVTTAEFMTVSDRTFDNEHWVSILYRCSTEGEPANMEPDKHLQIAWHDLGHLPEEITAPSRDAIDAFRIRNRCIRY